MSKDLEYRIKSLEKKIDDLQYSLNEVNTKLSKHIEFIDKTYESLKNPIKTVTGFFGTKKQ